MHDKIDPNSMIPKYKQLINIITTDIDSGKLKPGDKLPTEMSFMHKYNISRITIRAAITELAEEGILVRSHGKGTYVALTKSVYKADDHFGFTRSCILDGKKPFTKIISSGWILPTKQDTIFFNITENDKIIMTKRLRYVDNIPTLVETNHYPASFSFLLDENLEYSLLELLKNKYHINIFDSVRTLEVSYPVGDEAKLLEIAPTTPLLLFRDSHKNEKGDPLFISKQVYCTERHKFYL